MGLIGDVDSVWSRSGSDSGAFIDKVLDVAEQVADTINLIANIFAGAKERKLVVSDYRKASLTLPKYYKSESGEHVATISLIDAVSSGGSDRTKKGGGDWSGELIDGEEKDTFLLKGIQEVFKERSQIVETFGEDFAVFFTGKSPSVFLFSGVLINDAYRNWKSLFIDGYRRYMNSSECARRKLKVRIFYDYVTIEGYLLDLSVAMDSSDDVNVPFNFNVLVTDYYDYGVDGFSEAPVYGGQLGWPLDSSALSRFASGLLTAFIPGLAGSGFEPVIGGVVDDIFNEFVSKSTQDKISGRMAKGSDIYTSVGTAIALPGIIGGAIGAKSATSSSIATSTSSLVDASSGVVSGDFGTMVNDIELVNQQFSK